MLTTALLFSLPFASPGRTLFERKYPEKDKAYLTAFKSLLFLALAGGFAYATMAGLEVLSDVGLLASLSLAFYLLFPVAPLPGHDLYSASKLAWFIFFACLGGLYVACLMKALPLAVYTAIGAVALGGNDRGGRRQESYRVRHSRAGA